MTSPNNSSVYEPVAVASNKLDPYNKIFIGGILPTTTQDKLQKHFEQYGKLSDCVLIHDKATGKPRGFGFITYRDPKVVDRVLEQSQIVDNKKLDCKRAVPRDVLRDKSDMAPKDRHQTRKIFVGGLPLTITETDFKAYFEQFGTIEDSKVLLDKETGRPRGFGFVTFSSEDAVEKVIARYNDNKIGDKWIECKRAVPKETSTPSPSRTHSNYSRDSPRNFPRRDDRSRSRSKAYSQPDASTYTGTGSQNNLFQGSEGYYQHKNYDDTNYNHGHSNNYPQPYYPLYNSGYEDYTTGYPSQYYSNMPAQYQDPYYNYNGSGGSNPSNEYTPEYYYGNCSAQQNAYYNSAASQPVVSQYPTSSTANTTYTQEVNHNFSNEVYDPLKSYFSSSTPVEEGKESRSGHLEYTQKSQTNTAAVNYHTSTVSSNYEQQQQKTLSQNGTQYSQPVQKSIGPVRGAIPQKQSIEGRYYNPF